MENSVLGSFGRVWGRVTGSEPLMPDEAERLRVFIESSLCQERLLASLSRALPSVSRQLGAMAGELRRLAAELKLERYLLTGESFRDLPSCELPAGRLASLRRAYVAAGESADAFAAAGASVLCPRLRRIYTEAAAGAERRGDALRGLIARALGQ